MGKYISRLAVPADIPRLLKLPIIIYDENKEALILGEFTTDNFESFVEKIVYSNSVLVLEEDNDIFASCGMMIQPCFMTHDKIATDAWILCRKDKRGYAIFREMLRFAKNFSIINHARLILRITSASDTERKIKLYEKSGFSMIGATLLYTGS